ncbi:MAG: hypothetical protein QM817_31795 [Archangium sp.]
MNSRALAAFVTLALLAGCGPATPELGKLISPVITAQRRNGGALQVILTYDNTKTACGAVKNLRATLDGQNVAASAGSFDPMQMNEADKCQFPGFLITPDMKSTPREIIFTDEVTTMNMTVTTLELGTAIADSPPATLRSNYMLRWLTSPPSQGTSSYKVSFTPNGGAEATWAEGTSLGTTLTTPVPTQTVSANGTVTLSWLVNSMVTKCEVATSCTATIQGSANFPAVVQP